MVALLGSAQAQGSGFGVGVIAGEPTGLSVKRWLGHVTAFDAAAAWSLLYDPGMHVHADFLLHFMDVFDIPAGKLPLYVGVGGRIKIRENDLRLGARVPVGIAWLLPFFPVDLFLELAPTFDLVTTSNRQWGATGGVGGRIFFR
jgi:hypothetical protein